MSTLAFRPVLSMKLEFLPQTNYATGATCRLSNTTK